MSYPLSRRWVAKLCLRVCTEACFVIPAFPTATLNAFCLLLNSQVVQKVLEISSVKLMRLLFANKAPETTQPDEIDLFCAKGPVSKPEGTAHPFFKKSPSLLMEGRFADRR